MIGCILEHRRDNLRLLARPSTTVVSVVRRRLGGFTGTIVPGVDGGKCGRTVALRGVHIRDDGGTDLAVGGDIAGGGFERARLPVKTAPTLVMADDGGIFPQLPCLRHRCCSSCLLARSTLGEPQIWVSRIRRWQHVVLSPSWGIVFWSRCSLEGT
jgi:hypothetical protein